jgi:hypothetical protein
MAARILAVLAACGLLGGCALLGNARTAQRLPPSDYRLCLTLAPMCTASNVLYKPGGLNLFTQKSRFRQGIFVGFIIWHDWGAATATGTGVATIFTCKQNCGSTYSLLPPQGTTSSDLTLIVAADPKPWHGNMVYSRVTARVPTIGWHEVYDKGLLPSRPQR